MKNLVLTFFLMCLAAAAANAQAGAITGFWLTEDRDSQIEIYRTADNKFNGRIVWLEEPLNESGRPKVDDKNPDRSLRTRPTLGLEILQGFSHDPSKRRSMTPKTGELMIVICGLTATTLFASRVMCWV